MNNPTIQIQKIRVREDNCVYRFTISTNDVITRYEFIIDNENARWLVNNLRRMIDGGDKNE